MVLKIRVIKDVGVRRVSYRRKHSIKRQATGAMLVAWTWTSCFLSCAASWHVCLVHIGENL